MEAKPYHHKNLKHTLIEKGIELVSAEGVSSFSLRRVAAACGVSHAAPYSHFKNKEELLRAMQQHITERFAAYLEAAVERHENQAEQLLYMGEAYVMFFVKNPHYFSFMQSYPQATVDLSANSRDAENYKPYVILRRAVFSMMEHTCLTKEEINDLCIALWAQVHGIASIAAMRNVTFDQAWETKIVDLLMAPCKLAEAGT